MLELLTNSLLGLPRSLKRFLAMAVDAVLCVTTVWLAYYLRLGHWTTLRGSPVFVVIASLSLMLPILYVAGLYRTVLRYISADVVWTITRAMAIYALVFSAIFTGYGFEGVPRTIGFIQPLLMFVGTLLIRAALSFLLRGRVRNWMQRSSHTRILIYGAGASGRQLAAAIGESDGMRVVGFLDDNPALHGRSIGKMPIMNPVAIEETIASFDVQNVFLAIPSATRAHRNQILMRLRKANVNVRTLPNLMDIASGQVTVNDLRELTVEDLLGRDPVPPDTERMQSMISGKTVLVTGAGGSIGSELCRQILTARPALLILFDASEYALYSIDRELRSARPDAVIIPLLGSVSDDKRVREILDAWPTQVIFHAAAYKHVPLVEYNLLEGIRNNTIGTLITAQAASDAGVEQFVLVSTDKAVRPTNSMGATKRLAEMILQGLQTTGTRTRFCMVRFGNVLGSSGSVVPLFREQIRAGGPVTVTDAAMTRYFMTIPEAAQLVVQAGSMANGGEVFLLDMGEPVRIIDLARNMIELSGMTIRDDHNSSGDIELQVVGLRPGEKLFEELLIGNNSRETAHPRIMMASEAHPGWHVLRPALAALADSIEQRDAVKVRTALLELVPEFAPTSELVDWVFVERGAATATVPPPVAASL